MDIYQYRDDLIAKLAQVEGVIAGMGGSASTKKQRAPYGSKTVKSVGPKKRRKMSAAARKAIGDAQRARWAKQKSTKK